MSSTTTSAMARVVRLERSRDPRRAGPMGEEPLPVLAGSTEGDGAEGPGVAADPGRAGVRAGRALPRPGPEPGRAGGRGPLGTLSPPRRRDAARSD
jgi:hypothetical protein